MKRAICFFVIIIISAFNQAKSDYYKISDLFSIDGISMSCGARCVECCDILFDERFGHKNNEQFNILLSLLRDSEKYENDINAMPLSYYILDHIVHLAIDMQDHRSASFILYPSVYGGANIGGELLGLFAVNRQAKVLMGFDNLNLILIPGTEMEFVKNITGEALLVLTDETILDELVNSLEVRGYYDLAGKFENERSKIKAIFYKKK